VEVRANGQNVLNTSTVADGTYNVHLTPGDYSVIFSAVDYLGKSFGDVHIVQDQTTTLDTSLQSCTWIKNVDVAFTPFRPQISETVTFTATVGAGKTPISYAWQFGDGQDGSGQTVDHSYSAQGGYLADMTASNACGVPVTIHQLVPVEVELYYLPLISKATQN
jgi:PKD repeat protein